MPTGDQGGRDRQRISSAKFWLKSALAIVAVGSFLAWAWMPSHPDEPVYQGKTMSEWIKIYSQSDDGSEEEKKAEAAFQNIGTNVVPALLKMIQTPDSSFRTMLKALMRKQSFIGPDFQDAEDIRNTALFGFRVIGEDTKGAVPELLSLVKRGSGTVGREEAIDALGYIGPSAQAAIPTLMAVVSDVKDQNRSHAVYSLGLISSSAESVVPFLVSCLRDSDEGVRWRAANALSQYDEAAKSSVPALVPLLADPSEYVRKSTTNALKRIDPAAAAAAGIK
ncbi:MAG: HEAT repeat domain-containing protein [Limisphaerales bacterium]